MQGRIGLPCLLRETCNFSLAFIEKSAFLPFSSRVLVRRRLGRLAFIELDDETQNVLFISQEVREFSEQFCSLLPRDTVVQKRQ